MPEISQKKCYVVVIGIILLSSVVFGTWWYFQATDTRPITERYPHQGSYRYEVVYNSTNNELVSFGFQGTFSTTWRRMPATSPGTNNVGAYDTVYLRERWLNGSWQTEIHGPFFVDWLRIDTYEYLWILNQNNVSATITITGG
jgi:hypothetical protein